jgi:hypothetical protein
VRDVNKVVEGEGEGPQCVSIGLREGVERDGTRTKTNINAMYSLPTPYVTPSPAATNATFRPRKTIRVLWCGRYVRRCIGDARGDGVGA